MNLAKPSVAAPRVFPAWLPHRRELLAVPVAFALVLGAPGLAYAAFTARTTAALTVGTYTVPAPASINGTLECTTIQGKKGAAITLKSIDPVPLATGYTATLASPSGPQEMKEIPAEDTAQQIILLSKGNGKGTYTFALFARVGSWTGPQLQQSVSC